MTDLVLRVACRPYDHLTPLALGEVRPTSFQLELVRSDRTPDLATRPDLDGSEASAAKLLLAAANGEKDLVPVPAFVLTAFRHRCLVTTRDSPLHEVADLRGRRVGLTGWPDTGQVWTRAALRAAGLEQAEVEWFVGPMTADEPPTDRIGPLGAPSNVAALPSHTTLLDALQGGLVDALALPTMPAGFYGPASPLRHLLVSYRDAEVAYYREVGLVPGIHLIALRREVVAEHPSVLPELVGALSEAYAQWLHRRVTLVDTTPWLAAEIDAMAHTVGLDWNPYRIELARTATAALAEEMLAQGLLPCRVAARELFAEYDRAVGGA